MAFQGGLDDNEGGRTKVVRLLQRKHRLKGTLSTANL